MNAIKKVIFAGFEALELRAGDYVATMIPSVGANLVRLYHTSKEIDLLHYPAPDNGEMLASRPQIFGLPVLFPPNRIDKGVYTYQGRSYQFPITIAKDETHHHGMLKGLPFVVTACKTTDTYAEVEASYFANEFQSAYWEAFPHTFTCRITYRLSEEGLRERISFTNHSKQEMPLGVGFHTAIKMPFIEGTSPEEYTIQLSVGKRWELDSKCLPTGVKQLPPDNLKDLATTGINAAGMVLDAAFTAQPLEINGAPYHGAILTHKPTGAQVYYQAGDMYQHWVLWNNGGGHAGFICPEPQTWITNAPNMSLPASETGFQTVQPGATWQGETKLYVG